MAMNAERALAVITLDANTKRFEARMRGSQKRLLSFARSMKGNLGTALKGLGGPMAGLAGIASIGGIAAVGADVLGFEQNLTRLQIAAEKSPFAMDTLRQSLRQVSSETGIAANDLLAGVSQFVAATGDFDGAAQNVRLFAQVVNASGATMEDVASTAAALKDNLNVDPKDFEQAFSALITQGKMGAVELKDLASELSGLAPTFSQFAGGQGVQGIVDLGAAIQATKKGFGSASEAATGMNALMSSITRNAGKLKKEGGVKVFTKNTATGKKEAGNLLDIVDQIANSKLAKNPEALTKALGSSEAKRAYDQLVLNRGLIQTLREEGIKSNAVQKDSLLWQESSAGRIAAAWQEMRNVIAEAFTPERIQAFANVLEKTVKLAATLAGWIDKFTDAVDLDPLQQALKEGKEQGKGQVWIGKRALEIEKERKAQKALDNPTARANFDALYNAGGQVAARLLAPSPAPAAAEPAPTRAGRKSAGRRGDRNTTTVNVAVRVNDREIADATANAQGQRTRPGGR